MIALDCESTGLDIYHSARPFFVTICREDGSQTFWEWDVDPLTREVMAPREDLLAVKNILDIAISWGKQADPEVRERHKVVLQNGKYDSSALCQLIPDLVWPWEMVHDTIIAGHLLSSHLPHDLTNMCRQWLQDQEGNPLNIQPFEDALEVACKEARKFARKHFPTWKISKDGMDGAPSVKGSKAKGKSDKDKLWKNDMWLPRAIAREVELPSDHTWWTVLRDYSNADSTATLELWRAMESELKNRGQWEVYLERMKAVPMLAKMESKGTTFIIPNLQELQQQFREDSEEAGKKCVGIAESYGLELELPKSGRNNSLRDLCFGDKGLRLPIVHRTETGQPSLDSENAIPEYLATLPVGSKQRMFIQNLARKQKRDTALGFFESYLRFGKPHSVDPTKGHFNCAGDKYVMPDPRWMVLHSSINPTATATLRMSSSNPNLQQVSKQEVECEKCQGDGCGQCRMTGFSQRSTRYIFGPAPGREWWSLDYENIELRIPGYISGEEAMIDLFEKPDDPPYFGSYHLLNASIVYPDLFWPLAEQKGAFKKRWPEVYQRTKNGGFGKQYGGQRKKVDATFGVQGAFDLLNAKLPKLEALNKNCIRQANNKGYIETVPDKTVGVRGYRLHFNRSERGGIKPTLPLNYFVQSTAMWCSTKGAVRCHQQLGGWNRQDGKDRFITLFPHDELVFDFPAKPDMGNLPHIKKIKQLMEQSGDDIGVPLSVAVTYNPVTWAEGESVQC